MFLLIQSFVVRAVADADFLLEGTSCPLNFAPWPTAPETPFSRAISPYSRASAIGFRWFSSCTTGTASTTSEKMRTRMIAESRYAVLAVDMCGQGIRPTDAPEWQAESTNYCRDSALLRRRVRAAIDFARTLPHVAARKMAAIGYCLGR